jgi:hypothetical protein
MGDLCSSLAGFHFSLHELSAKNNPFLFPPARTGPCSHLEKRLFLLLAFFICGEVPKKKRFRRVKGEKDSPRISKPFAREGMEGRKESKGGRQKSPPPLRRILWEGGNHPNPDPESLL